MLGGPNQGEPSEQGQGLQQPVQQVYDQIWNMLQTDLNNRFAYINDQNAAQQQMLQTLSSQFATMANNNTPTTTLGQNTPNQQPGS